MQTANRFPSRLLLPALAAAWLTAGPVPASAPAAAKGKALTPEEEGYLITKKYHDMGRNFGNYSVDANLYIIDQNQDTVVRNLKFLVIERGDDEDYSIAQAQNPPDVRGTTMMTYYDPKGEHRQWIYLPELRRVKKINAENRSGAYFGSELAYEDITSLTLNQYTFKKIGEKVIDGREFHAVEKHPTYKYSGYSRIITYISKDMNLIEHVEFFDHKNTLFKTLHLTKWEKERNTWYSGTFTVHNLVTGRKTVLDQFGRRVDIGLTEQDFTQASMQRLIKSN